MTSPLEYRIFKKKNPTMVFYCPLCRTERAFSCIPRLTWKNYVQVVIISFVLVFLACTYTSMGPYSLIFAFITWGAMEFAMRVRFRKEIPCPHCGFDASWYKRDVKIARKLVSNFWDGRKSAKEEGDEQLEIPSDIEGRGISEERVVS